jgi:DNA/RNA endonuclease G (NUC1)
MSRRLFLPRPAVWFAAALLAACFTADQPTALRQPPSAARRTVTTSPGVLVISQIYGAGGNSGSTLKNDFIELFNPGTSAVDVTGWSVQYTSAAGSGTWLVTALPSKIVPSGGYFLVQESQGAGGTQNLPTPDATGTIAMSGTDGKVALTSSTTALSGTCPTGDATAIDLVSYGSGNCSLPNAAAAQVLTVTTADFRNQNGCAYTGNASVDFTRSTAAPRNSTSPTNTCVVGGQPATVTVTPSSTSVFAGFATNLSASAVDAAQNPVSTTFTWSTSDQNIATVDANGVVTGVAAGGPVTITATAANNVFGTATVTVTPVPPPSTVVISQVYGGGGNSGATFTNDFVELFNAGTAAADITGYTIQYSSATGTSFGGGLVVTMPSATIPAGHYYLVQLASQAAVGAALPTPDVAFTNINMSGTSGKVILAQPGITPSGSCPTGAGIADFVEYGTSANCTTTWGGTTSNTGNTTAAFRKNDGCVQSNNVANDWVVLSVAPRNSASPAKSCIVGPLDHVLITGPSSVSAGSTIQLNATPQDASNNTVSGATITWSTTDPSTATVDGSGVVTGVAASGNAATIKASVDAGGITKEGSTQITVTNPGGINWVDVSVSSASFPAGFQAQLFATARTAQGGTVIPATFTFTSLDPGIAAIALVQNTGLITGVSGSATHPRITITATPTGGGTPYAFTSSPVTIEVPVSASPSIYAVNDEFGDPTSASGSKPNDLLIVRPQYTLSYNTSRGTPNWVSYELDARQMVAGQDRCNCFTADPLLPAAAQIFTSDYTGGGFDRGHMTRSADRTAANGDNAATFYLTNVVPQQADLNQGVWAQFENALADSTHNGRAVYIITGPLFTGGQPAGTIKNEGKIWIPDHTWKIAVIGPDPGGVPFTKADVQTLADLANVTVLAVNMPNIAGVRNDPWQNYLTTVSALETATGYNFLSLLSEAMQCKIEVRNCVPVPVLTPASGANTVAAGTGFVLNVSGSDADGADGPWKIVIDWGDGTSSTTTSFSMPTDSRPLARGKIWSAPSVYVVRVTITDKKGGQGVATLNITVTP